MKLWDTSWQTLPYSSCQHKARILSTSRVDSQYAMFCQRFGIGSSTFENICLLSRNRFYSSIFLLTLFSLSLLISLSLSFFPHLLSSGLFACVFFMCMFQFLNISSYLPSTQILIKLPILKWQI